MRTSEDLCVRATGSLFRFFVLALDVGFELPRLEGPCAMDCSRVGRSVTIRAELSFSGGLLRLGLLGWFLGALWAFCGRDGIWHWIPRFSLPA